MQDAGTHPQGLRGMWDAVGIHGVVLPVLCAPGIPGALNPVRAARPWPFPVFPFTGSTKGCGYLHSGRVALGVRPGTVHLVPGRIPVPIHPKRERAIPLWHKVGFIQREKVPAGEI